MRIRPFHLIAVAAMAFGAVVAGQQADSFVDPVSHAAIRYGTVAPNDAIVSLNRRIQDGSVRLQFDPVSGYLRSVLEALNVPTESQMLVFSKTSFQAALINMFNPRALYFNDTVSVGWVRGADALEVSALDARQGMSFYTLPQKPSDRPQFERNTTECMQCHLTWETLGVPGLIAMSTFPMQDDKLSYANGFPNDHRSPFPERWGGWYVTGNAGAARHMGNVGVMVADRMRSKLTNPLAPRTSVEGLFDLKGFLTPYSDVAALMVLSHQVRATNMIVRTAWEARVADASPNPDRAARVRKAATDLADYLLYVGEVPLGAPMRSTSGFPQKFAATGPRDGRGRSLREMDLTQRMMRYPASYMIYSEAFDALPASAKDIVYSRMWEILSGRDRAQKYMRLTLADRQAVVEILRDTKKDLPSFFQPVTR